MLAFAALPRIGTALVETAPTRPFVRGRHRAGNDGESLALRTRARHGRHETFRVGMVRLREQLAHACLLDDLARVHDDDTRRRLGHYAQVVRDEQHRHGRARAQRRQQLENLRLDRDIECGGRLIRDEERGREHQRHPDHHALPHSTGELMRIRVRALRRIRNAHGAEHLDRTRPCIAATDRLVHARNLGQLRPHRKHRIERRHRLLKDHRDAIAPNSSHRFVVERQEIRSVELDPGARLDAAGRLNESKQRKRRNRLPAPRLADHAYRFIRGDAEGDAIHRARDAGARAEVRAKLLNGQQRRGCHHRST